MRIEDNIWKFYIYRILGTLIFVTPIFVLFLLENNLTMMQVMILQAYYALIIVLFRIPSGVFTDFAGRRKAIIISQFLFLASWIFYALGTNFLGFIIAETLIGISSALWGSASSAFIYDTLAALGKEEHFKKIFGAVTSINYLVWGIASLAGGYIASVYGLRMTFWATALPIAISCLIPLFFVEPYVHKPLEKKYLAHIREAIRFSLSHPKVKFFIIYSMIFGGVGAAAYFFYQPYFKLIKIDIFYFGVIFFLMNIAGAIGSKFAHNIENMLGEKTTLYAMLIIPIISFLFLWKLLIPLAVFFPIIKFFIGGFSEPVLEDYVNKHIQTHHRATILSLKNLGGDLLFSILSPILGYLADLWSIQTAFLISAIILFADLVILHLFMHIRSTEYSKWTPKTAE
ncbi:MFS transporter [Candidatus Woesearchaeota archaeon]|nr:MFS transporter [Candidatus Woesearchaeota archaeon]